MPAPGRPLSDTAAFRRIGRLANPLKSSLPAIGAGRERWHRVCTPVASPFPRLPGERFARLATEEDSAWKDILGTHFKAFVQFFFPEIHRDIDWSRGYETPDKELEVILRGSKSRKRRADKLAKVHLLSGRPAVILIHVEVQKSPEADLECRMFQYNYRIFDRRSEEVISLAVLTDCRSSLRRDCFEKHRSRLLLHASQSKHGYNPYGVSLYEGFQPKHAALLFRSESLVSPCLARLVTVFRFPGR